MCPQACSKVGKLYIIENDMNITSIDRDFD